MSEKVLEKTKLVNCKTPRELVIADDWYLEKLEELKGTRKRKEKESYKNLIFEDEKIIRNWKTTIVIENVEEDIDDMDDFDDFTITGTLIKIALARPLTIGKNKKDLCDVFVEGRMLTSNNEHRVFSYETKELGCDTAKFSVYADDKFYEFRTGADGYYGSAITHFEELSFPIKDEVKKEKNTIGYYIELYLSEDAYSYEEIVDIMKYLFGGDAIEN